MPVWCGADISASLFRFVSWDFDDGFVIELLIVEGLCCLRADTRFRRRRLSTATDVAIELLLEGSLLTPWTPDLLWLVISSCIMSLTLERYRISFVLL